MRRHCKVIAAIGVALLLAAPALAQFRGGGGLINNTGVQKELKLSDEQIDKAKSAVKDAMGKFTKEDRPGKDATPEQRAEFEKKVSDATHKALADILKPEQIKRLKQIELQQRGLRDLDAQKELKLTDEQKGKLEEMVQKAGEERRELFKGFDKDNPKETVEKLSKLDKDSREKELGLLTDPQKKTWKELTGEPFEVKFEPRPKN